MPPSAGESIVAAGRSQSRVVAVRKRLRSGRTPPADSMNSGRDLSRLPPSRKWVYSRRENSMFLSTIAPLPVPLTPTRGETRRGRRGTGSSSCAPGLPSKHLGYPRCADVPAQPHRRGSRDSARLRGTSVLLLGPLPCSGAAALWLSATRKEDRRRERDASESWRVHIGSYLCIMDAKERARERVVVTAAVDIVSRLRGSKSSDTL